ncbi:hypothetical protein D7V64_08870 [Acinetobacter cumulans]|uniref:CheW-like domain-containing protein n=1 Tax=Acinetobacter cumulans TaxID=2136182 RepID=A0A3A8G0Q1_9GAMM|nr:MULTISPECIES: hypothetical protein [Acinetobacter]NWK74761.1 hypothetical protein [Acinetobacter sp. SwsAc6]QCO21418.1 hypothetical protein C9E88_007765 [Acinetobacter cumulans]RFS29614.1 hypothetical protein DYI81_11930 [Acinetobacter sp. SWAC5]RKG42864.1 hypothetical protein D7V51_10620 [Acinetobacter cumulans]RKG49146.1 hypothetical protein D7V68_06525 [Acinetobacter cumulans]
MTEQTSVNTVTDKINQQELQHLITVSTGFIDAYIIECHGKEPMLLPQNIILSALDSETKVQFVQWHELKLPVYAVNQPERKSGVALVIEGEDVQQRFALMCDEMPKTIRLRISEIVDEDKTLTDPAIFQYVRMGEKVFHIPNMNYIQTQLQS